MIAICRRSDALRLLAETKWPTRKLDRHERARHLDWCHWAARSLAELRAEFQAFSSR